LAVLLASAGLWFTSAALAQEAGEAKPEPAAPAAPGAETPPPAPPFYKADGLNSGDTAWMLTSSALVLMMTAPGLALFYGGLVRKKNILSVMMQCLALMGVMSVIWAIYGYSLAFGGDVAGGFVGDGAFVMLKGVMPTWTGSESVVPMVGGIPRLVHMVFQMMFFIITPGLICGAFAERMKFSAMFLFSILWGTLVYCPLAHWVWSDTGWFNPANANVKYAAFDFAGGLVVHISSGVSALVCCLFMGKRKGYGTEPMPPHNMTYTAIGATMLWVGWFGFNAGSAGSSGVSAANAFVATHMAAAVGCLAWPAMEWLLHGKPTVLGACSGLVAGLVCITPAAGTADPVSGMLIGLAAGVVCFLASTKLKNAFKYDDSLDAFGVHGVGGTLGAILTGVFASKAVTGNPDWYGLLEGKTSQVVNQAISVGAAVALSVVGTVILLVIVNALVGLRVTLEEETIGLDVTQHGEEGYIFQ
jgi:Amt family ammonium transporter